MQGPAPINAFSGSQIARRDASQNLYHRAGSPGGERIDGAVVALSSSASTSLVTLVALAVSLVLVAGILASCEAAASAAAARKIDLRSPNPDLPEVITTR